MNYPYISDEIEPSFPVLYTRIFKDKKLKFIVSTVDRPSSAFGYGNMRYLETMAWSVTEDEKPDEILYQDEGFRSHLKAVEMLHKDGKIIEESDE